MPHVLLPNDIAGRGARACSVRGLGTLLWSTGSMQLPPCGRQTRWSCDETHPADAACHACPSEGKGMFSCISPSAQL